MFAVLLLTLSYPQQSSLHLIIDEAKQTGSISPYIYGSNEGDWAAPTRHLTFGRQGGNRMTAYNWENNASNAGSDWHNQSDNYLGGGDIPGEVPRKAVAEAQAAGASFLVTIPLAGYVAADKRGDGDVNQTPNFLQTRFNRSLPKKPSAFTYPPNLNDGVVYQDEFVNWLEHKFTNRQEGANIWYSLDNEPDLWGSTHSRIHPDKPTYAEIVGKGAAMAKAIKAVAPKTLVFGPASYGWGGYVNFQGAPDANGRDFLEFYLSSMKQAEADAGKRLLDVLDLHWYPEVYGDGKRIVEQLATPGIAKARMQATRSLWDPSFVEDSWIAKSIGGMPINLIPRMQDKIARCYPGTKLAFTEYQYGGGNDISGAIAQADALGIFGREGVFAAALWPLSGDSSFVHAGFDAFRNYDGAGAHFGEIELKVTNPDPAYLGCYASATAKGNRVVIVLTNQRSTSVATSLTLKNSSRTTMRQFSLTSAKSKLLPGSFATKDGSNLQLRLPPLSVDVIELN